MMTSSEWHGQTNERADPGELDPEYEELVGLLVAGKKPKDIAERLEVSTRTIRRRRDLPQVQRAVAARQREIGAAATAQALSLRDKAIRVFDELLDSGSDSVKLQAARTVLAVSRQARIDEVVEKFDERLDDLEYEVRRRAQS